MNKLRKLNKELHEKRPLTPSNKKITLWKSADGLLQCCIESQGCRFSKEYGSCIMCDYGTGVNLTPNELKEVLEKELQPALKGVDRLLIGTYGSILDTYEISSECFDVILDFVEKQNLKTIIFETHYDTVTTKILQKIQDKLSPKFNVAIEMGYESYNQSVLNNCLQKNLQLDQLLYAMNLIHRYSFEVILNVLLGSPFMSTPVQLHDALKSIDWAFKNGADWVVIFPCNIKPFTVLYELYKFEFYQRISHWLVIDFLRRVPDKYLSKISLSWYGDRDNFYDDKSLKLIPPEDCKDCHDKLFEFYEKFMKNRSATVRKMLLDDFISSTKCECYNKWKRKLDEFPVLFGELSVTQVSELLEEIRTEWYAE